MTSSRRSRCLPAPWLWQERCLTLRCWRLALSFSMACTFATGFLSYSGRVSLHAFRQLVGKDGGTLRGLTRFHISRSLSILWFLRSFSATVHRHAMALASSALVFGASIFDYDMFSFWISKIGEARFCWIFTVEPRECTVDPFSAQALLTVLSSTSGSWICGEPWLMLLSRTPVL